MHGTGTSARNFIYQFCRNGLRTADKFCKDGNIGNQNFRWYCSKPTQEPTSPLKGIRILDLSRVLAGPFCTMILGDLGAEVIKVERPGHGDDTRNWGPPFLGTESCYFLSINRNKKSIAVNMQDPDGAEIIRKLAQKSDVLVENYIPGKLDAYGLDYSALKTFAPHLIYCSITGYGLTGPYQERGGYDVIAASVGGLLSITGQENGEPCKVGVAITDIATGLYAHGAILAALIQRQSTGHGQQLDCNLLSTQVACLINQSSNYLNAGEDSSRHGTAHKSIVPYQSFRTSDGYITIGAGNNRHFEMLCKRLGLKHLANDERFSTNANRVKHRHELVSLLSEKLMENTTATWLKRFEGCQFPFGALNKISQVFSDPQVIHSKIVQEMDHPSGRKIKVTGPPVHYSDSKNVCRLPPPLLGQHTEEILSSILNLDKAKIDTLKNKNVIQ